MKKFPEYLIETDVILEHLTHDNEEPSHLERLMQTGLCFTTVLNSYELLFAIPEESKSYVLDTLGAMKVLGLHPRYSLLVSEYSDKIDLHTAIICTVAKINKLPIVSFNTDLYINTGIKILNPMEIE